MSSDVRMFVYLVYLLFYESQSIIIALAKSIWIFSAADMPNPDNVAKKQIMSTNPAAPAAPPAASCLLPT